MAIHGRMVTYDFSGSESDGFGLAYRDAVELREGSAVIERTAPVMDWVYVDLVGEDGARRLSASFLDPGYLELLGTDAVVGRTFTEDEHGPGWASTASWPESVKGRTREIGVRLALGARTSRVVAGVALGGLATLVAGALAGLIMVAGGGRLLETALYGVEVWDPLVLAAAALLLLLVGTGASLTPALRAAAVDPSEALREE